mgnify:CR=1 FL=1
MLRRKIGIGIASILVVIVLMLVNHWFLRYIPFPNWRPTHWFHIEGNIDKRLFTSTKVTWLSVYVATNPACTLPINLLEGIDETKQVQSKLHLAIDKHGHFQGKIALDRYASGFCRWQVRAIAYFFPDSQSRKLLYLNHYPQLNRSHPNIIAYFYKQSTRSTPKRASIIFKCRDSTHCLINEKHTFQHPLNPSHSYQFHLSIHGDHR